MKIDFSKILLNPGNVLNVKADIELDSIKTSQFEYQIYEKKPVFFEFIGRDKNCFKFDIETEMTLLIPCSRCLDEVKVKIVINTSKHIDLTKKDFVDDGSDENFEDFNEFIQGTELDVDKLLYGEILINLPMKVLCSNDCKGICNRCGTNLNHSTCGCDTTVTDPRMAKILDVYNSFKEV